MREILFRGRSIYDDSWVEGCLVRRTMYYGDPVAERDFIIYDGEFDAVCHFYKEVDPASVGQFTGVNDVNGNPIFEGDIVKAVMHGGNYDLYEFPIACVRFEKGAFCTSTRSRETPFHSYAPTVSFEIVGNIYDNPELLGGERA